jgi:hypothetical protein
MQEAYDNLGRAFPLRYPEDPYVKSVFLKARELVNDSRAILERAYSNEERRPSTEAERAQCRRLGCGPGNWIDACPLHGDDACELLARIESAKSRCKTIMVEAKKKHADLGAPPLSFWEGQSVRAELAFLALTVPAPQLLLESLRTQLRKRVVKDEEEVKHG